MIAFKKKILKYQKHPHLNKFVSHHKISSSKQKKFYFFEIQMGHPI